MEIVSERTMEPRPLQRPSDVERRPADFGIEAPPPPAAKPEATIIKGAISRDPEVVSEPMPVEVEPNPPVIETDNDAKIEDDWGEGIL